MDQSGISPIGLGGHLPKGEGRGKPYQGSPAHWEGYYYSPSQGKGYFEFYYFVGEPITLGWEKLLKSNTNSIRTVGLSSPTVVAHDKRKISEWRRSHCRVLPSLDRFSSFIDNAKIPQDSGQLLLGVAGSGLPSFLRTGCESVYSLHSQCSDVRLAAPDVPVYKGWECGRLHRSTWYSSSPNGTWIDPPARAIALDTKPPLLSYYPSCSPCLLPVAHSSLVVSLVSYSG
jgi:hypothetical protein